MCASCKREFKTIDDLGVHCKEYHKAEEKSTNDNDENHPKLATINVQDVTIENVDILPNNVSGKFNNNKCFLKQMCYEQENSHFSHRSINNFSWI